MTRPAYAALYVLVGALLYMSLEKILLPPEAQVALSVRPAPDAPERQVKPAASGLMTQPLGMPCETWARESHDFGNWNTPICVSTKTRRGK